MDIHMNGFRGTKATVDIFDIYGKRMLPSLTMTVYERHGRLNVDTSSLPSGMYIIHIADEYQKASSRWVKASR